jgi:hypothetical protein
VLGLGTVHREFGEQIIESVAWQAGLGWLGVGFVWKKRKTTIKFGSRCCKGAGEMMQDGSLDELLSPSPEVILLRYLLHGLRRLV